jgi:thioredoxin reductase (NADPH)
VRRHECGGLFIFIGADAETEWLPTDIACDGHGYVLTGDDLKKAGRWSHDRDPYLLETSVPGIFACGDVRLSPSSALRRRSVREAWRPHSFTNF